MTEQERFTEYKKLLKVYTLGMLMLEHCDDILHSPLIVRQLKKRTNLYIKSLEGLLKEPVKRLYDTDDEIYQVLQNSYSFLLEADIEDLPKIAANYLENKKK